MINWLKNYVDYFIHWSTNYEASLSGVNNLLGILAILVAIIGTLFGWWKQVLAFFKELTAFFRPIQLASQFPFEIITNRSELLKIIYPQLVSRTLCDYDIPYMDRAIDEELRSILHIQGKLIIVGLPSLGKTRSAVELASNLLNEDYIILVLKPYAWLETPLIIPETFCAQKVAIFIDNLERYLNYQNTKINQFPQISFLVRLNRAITQFENILGDSDKIRFIATAQLNSKAWQASGYDAKDRIWKSISVVEFPALTNNEQSNFIERLAKQSGINIAPSIIEEISKKNDNSFYPLITAFRQWSSNNISKITSLHTKEFDGQLGRVWERKYQQAIAVHQTARFIYGSLDILALAHLPAQTTLVTVLAIGLQNRFYLFTLSTILGYVAKDREFHAPIYKRWFWIINIVFRISLWLLLWPLFLPWELRTRSARKFIQKYEIPLKEGVFQVHEGQIEGRGKEWYNSEIAETLISEQSNAVGRIFSFLISLNESENMNLSQRISLISAAIRLDPTSAGLYHKRAHLYEEFKEFDLALADIERAITIEESNPAHYVCAHQIHTESHQYDMALKRIEKYQELTNNLIRATRMRANVQRRSGEFEKAILEYDLIISSPNCSPIDFVQRASCFRESAQYSKSFQDLQTALTRAKSKKQMAGIYHAIGHHFESLKESKQAIENWNHAIQLNPKDTLNFLCRAEMRIETGNLKSAEIDCMKVLQISKNNKRAKRILAEIHYLRGDYSLSREIIETDLLDSPRNIDSQILYVSVLFALNETYDHEAQLLGKLLEKHKWNEITKIVDKLNKLITNCQSKRSSLRVTNLVKNSFHKYSQSLASSID